VSRESSIFFLSFSFSFSSSFSSPLLFLFLLLPSPLCAGDLRAGAGQAGQVWSRVLASGWAVVAYNSRVWDWEVRGIFFVCFGFACDLGLFAVHSLFEFDLNCLTRIIL
jgi:hypothetical protein